MRGIKFRSWDSEANVMIYSDHRTRKLYDVYYGFEMNEKGELECRWEGEFTESHVLDGGVLNNIMQYTGLKDKNGVEIYEGDIVEAYFWNDKLKPVKEKGFIEFQSGSFILNFGDGTWDYLDGNEAALVIGNIYEKQELLEREGK